MYDEVARHVSRQEFMKPGANPSDITKIKQGFAEGKTAAQISQELLIKLSCVETFDPARVVENVSDDDSGSPEAMAFKDLKRAKRK